MPKPNVCDFCGHLRHYRICSEKCACTKGDPDKALTHD